MPCGERETSTQNEQFVSGIALNTQHLISVLGFILFGVFWEIVMVLTRLLYSGSGD
jgi:hypothetical protein